MQEEPSRCVVDIICVSLKLSQGLESGSGPRQTAGWTHPVKQWDELGEGFGVLLTFSGLNHLPDFMSAGIAFPGSLTVTVQVPVLLCHIFIFFNIVSHHLGIWWYAWSSLFLWHILVMGFFGILVCCQQILGNQEVFCYVVDYTTGFSEP